MRIYFHTDTVFMKPYTKDTLEKLRNSDKFAPRVCNQNLKKVIPSAFRDKMITSWSPFLTDYAFFRAANGLDISFSGFTNKKLVF